MRPAALGVLDSPSLGESRFQGTVGLEASSQQVLRQVTHLQKLAQETMVKSGDLSVGVALAHMQTRLIAVCAGPIGWSVMPVLSALGRRKVLQRIVDAHHDSNEPCEVKL
eukprot:2025827-Amphidinium_carterae.1